jgi:hypothetical protein
MVYSTLLKVGGAFVAASLLLLGTSLPGAAPLSVPASADPDTDGDGFSDAVEVATHSNPLDKNIVPKPEQVSPPATAQRDTDADGLTDQDELRYFTNLFLPDSDGDGVSDGQEIKNRTNPLNIFDN